MVKRINVFVFFQSEKLLTSNLVVTQVPAHVVIHIIGTIFFFCQRDLQGWCYFFGGKARGGGGYLNTSVVHMHDQKFMTLHLYFVTLLSLNPVPRG